MIEFDNHPALIPNLPECRGDGGEVHDSVADFAEARGQFSNCLTILASEFVSVPPNILEVHQDKPLMIGSDHFGRIGSA
jgi:hypothetical protein